MLFSSHGYFPSLFAPRRLLYIFSFLKAQVHPLPNLFLRMALHANSLKSRSNEQIISTSSGLLYPIFSPVASLNSLYS